jgi:hypothetical protein
MFTTSETTFLSCDVLLDWSTNNIGLNESDFNDTIAVPATDDELTHDSDTLDVRKVIIHTLL